MQEQINQLLDRISQLEALVSSRNLIQVQIPIDEVSRTNLNLEFVKRNGPNGSATTQNINLTGNPQTITPPAQPSGTLPVIVGGNAYNLLYA